MSNSILEFELSDGVATLTINRPEAANTITGELSLELMRAAIRCDEDPAVRAVLLRSRGPMFSGGGDLKSFAAHGDGIGVHIKETTTYLHAAVSRLTRMRAPSIAAVQGFAAGGGFSLAMCCDIVLAGESSRFTMAYTRAGLTPDGSSSYFLPRLVGLRRAMELTLLNRTLTAREALDWGLVTRVVDDDSLHAEAEALARQLAQGPTRAFGESKKLMHSGFHESLETQMELESRAISAVAPEHDAREGIQAFIEKRAPKFTGS